MKLEKAWYTIKQVAEKWGCTEDDVLHQINIYNLNPSFFFESVKCAVNKPRVKIGENGRPRCWLQKSKELPCRVDEDGKADCDKDSLCCFDEDGNICGNFDENTPVATHSGLVTLELPSSEFLDKWISVTRQWTGDLSECFFVPGPSPYNIDDERLLPLVSTPVTIDDILITSKELQRFESQHNKSAIESPAGIESKKMSPEDIQNYIEQNRRAGMKEKIIFENLMLAKNKVGNRLTKTAIARFFHPNPSSISSESSFTKLADKILKAD